MKLNKKIDFASAVLTIILFGSAIAYIMIQVIKWKNPALLLSSLS